MMQSDQLPAYRSYDGVFSFTDARGREGTCYLQVWEPRGSLPLAVACELASNDAASITNAASELATQIWQRLLPRAVEGVRYVEIYIDPMYPHLMEHAPAERFAEVIFQLDGNRLHSPQWTHISSATIEAMIGGHITVPIESSY